MPSYESLLSIAIDAARRAGALLRNDFLRPGGPRGHGEHADADQPAELLIRAALLAAAPDFSYRGEETAPHTGADPRHVWLVDPNDGTAAYLKGWRGTATSIGLLCDGVPVLGVVYAYAAPDNEGDLFAWAEGLPLTRNARPIERAPWPTAMTRDTVAIVSPSADHRPLANLQLLAPGKYRVEASIAYRLALAAAGDGDLAICLSSPGDWDYGGGHALLRAVGGELLDEHGRPVTYTREGESSTVHSFGGAPALLPALAAKPWNEVLFGQRDHADPDLDLCAPAPGQTIDDNALLQRVQGCWLGQLCGDALGSMVEFKGAAVLRRDYPNGLRTIRSSPVFGTLPGQPTDDSELALALARTLLRDRAYDQEQVARAYVRWYESRPFDCGNTVRLALAAMQTAARRCSSLIEAARAHASTSSEANGALMRQSPLAIWGASLEPEALDRIVRQDTALTHPSTACQDASAACTIALAAAIREGLDAEATYRRALAWNRTHGDSAHVTAALEAARHAPPENFSHTMGHVIIALQNAFYQALHAPSLEAGIVDTVMHGGDTDTNAAIAGALLGALHGSRAIPAQWRSAILTCRPQAGISSVQQPRPPWLWPADALILSERLAILPM